MVLTALVRAAGIEPASHAWEAHVLPMNYARLGSDVERVADVSTLPQAQIRKGCLPRRGVSEHRPHQANIPFKAARI